MDNVGTIEEEIARFAERVRLSMAARFAGNDPGPGEAAELLVTTLATTVITVLKFSTGDDKTSIRVGIREVTVKLIMFAKRELRA